MNSDAIQRGKNAIIGALVADAATMGLHWLYSQQRLNELAPEVPEFRTPSAADFSGNVGYFAHAGKVAGDLSHYGEQARVMLTSMAATQGQYDRMHYQEAFRSHFGYGGTFTGYIDRPTRQTLDTLYNNEREQLSLAGEIAFAGDDKQRASVMTRVLAAAKRYQGTTLIDAVTKMALSLPHPEDSRTYALALVAALESTGDYPGAHDEQLPAISKLPVLVARQAGNADLQEMVTSAVKVTNNAPRAIDYGQVSATTLRELILGQSINEAINEGLKAATSPTREHLTTVLAETTSVGEVTSKYGLNCDLGCGVASVMYNLRSATSFAQAVRQNILAGGDNCGRAIMLGAACGAHFGFDGDHGIPAAWLDRLPLKNSLLADIEKLFD
jgi:ADP-ribosylglycohydrolase